VGLTGDLGPGRAGVDTCLFIYLIEEDSRFLPVIEPLFEEADAGTRELVTSAVALLEVSRDQLRTAAQLRAATDINTPDALQLAAAVAYGCTAFVTNDRRLPEIGGTRILQLTDYVA
jgi:predicted nucleic acid-binding protein